MRSNVGEELNHRVGREERRHRQRREVVGTAEDRPGDLILEVALAAAVDDLVRQIDEVAIEYLVRQRPGRDRTPRAKVGGGIRRARLPHHQRVVRRDKRTVLGYGEVDLLAAASVQRVREALPTGERIEDAAPRNAVDLFRDRAGLVFACLDELLVVRRDLGVLLFDLLLPLHELANDSVEPRDVFVGPHVLSLGYGVGGGAALRDPWPRVKGLALARRFARARAPLAPIVRRRVRRLGGGASYWTSRVCRPSII